MRKRIILLMLVAAIVATAFYIICVGSKSMRLKFDVHLYQGDGSVRHYTVMVPIKESTTLTVVYKHSVIRLDVKDIVRVDQRGFHALWSELPDFGAGLPAEGTVEVATISDTASDYRVTVTGKRDFSKLTYLMIPLNRYRFYVDGRLVLMPEVNKTGRVDISLKRGCLPWQK